MIKCLSTEFGPRRTLAAIAAACLLMLGSCQTAAPPKSGETADERFEQLNSAARTAFRQGNISQAEQLYEKVLDRAYLRDDLPAVVDAKYNLAICRMRLRQYAEAMDAVQSAKRMVKDVRR